MLRRRFLAWMTVGVIAACSPLDLIPLDVIGIPGVKVSELSEDELGPVMDTINTRFRLYLALRAALPFEVLTTPGCLSNIVQLDDTVGFDADVRCILGAGSGLIRITEKTVSAGDGLATRFVLNYQQVVAGTVVVNGTEEVVEPEAFEEPSVRTLDLVQDDTPLAYTFHLNVLDGDQVVLDYALEIEDGTLLARISGPASPGALATVTLTGTDGVLTCELRNTPWVPGQPAKGFCEGGVSFGLPDGPLQ